MHMSLRILHALAVAILWAMLASGQTWRECSTVPGMGVRAQCMDTLVPLDWYARVCDVFLSLRPCMPFLQEQPFWRANQHLHQANLLEQHPAAAHNQADALHSGRQCCGRLNLRA